MIGSDSRSPATPAVRRALWWFLWVSCAAAGLPLARATAQACCGANSITDFGVVAPHAQATLASAFSLQQGFGSYSPGGEFSAARRLSDRNISLRLGGGVRLGWNRLQLHGSVPISLQQRASGDDSRSAWGLGDLSAVLRLTLMKPVLDGIFLDRPQSFIPLWDLFVGVKAPTGKGPARDQDPSLVDVFGNGAWELSLGTKVTKSVTATHLLGLKAQYDLRFATERDQGNAGQVDFKPGDQLSFRLEWIYAPNIFWSGAVFANLRLAKAVQIDGVTVPASDERLINAGVQVTYAFAYPDWDITFGVNSDAFWEQGGVNVPFAAFGGIVALRRTFVGGGHSEHEHHGHHGHHGH